MSAPASPRRILFASLIGTTIEFFDFYIYATAAVLVFPHLFFPAAEPAAATLQSLATFALAFFARPLGSAIFGHHDGNDMDDDALNDDSSIADHDDGDDAE